MSVPLLDLKAQYERIREDIDAAIRRVLESQHFVMGPEIEQFEAEIAEYCETRHAISCGSGSDALVLALMAHDIGPGDEVICPTYTFIATAGAIERVGATLVLADIDPGTYNVSLASLEEAVGRCSQPRAILPVHLFGQMAPMDEVASVAREFDAAVIEDAAQAIGSREPAGKRAGSHADIGCFSFYPSKNLGAYGDGGILTTDDESLTHRARGLRTNGWVTGPHHRHAGLNSRLDVLQAAILRVKLQYVDHWSHERRANAYRYDDLLVAAGAEIGPGDFKDLEIPIRLPARVPAPAQHVFNQYVVRVPAEHRDPLRAHLKSRGIDSAVYYSVPLHLQPRFGALGHERGDFPEAERAARETLALPIYSELTQDQIEAVVDGICGYFRR
ncbi:DegT/DnrJ/EryC1/StrS family aminotransferase [Myxococcota bacterium]|nr:DegT/DnrJ/EryC1/StrS family aminotransferase [Myxococcota bacterium]